MACLLIKTLQHLTTKLASCGYNISTPGPLPCINSMQHDTTCPPATMPSPFLTLADPQRVAAEWRSHPLVSHRHGLMVGVLPQGACLTADLPHCGEAGRSQGGREWQRLQLPTG